MKFLLGVCAAIATVFAFAWLVGGGLQPAAFVIVGVPWLFIALHALVHPRPAFCDDPGQANDPLCQPK